MIDDLRAKFEARLNAPSAPPLEVAGKFLRIYFSDNSDKEAHESIIFDASKNPRPVQLGLEGLNNLLANPPPQSGVLTDLVSWQANRRLDDPSNAGATIWLTKLAETAHEILKDQPPSRPAS